MKSIRILTLALALAAVAIPTSSFAAKGEKKGKGKGGAKAAAQYDANSNGMIDGTEGDALKKAFDADKTGPLKELDSDSDGKLSDGEVSAIKIRAKKKKN